MLKESEELDMIQSAAFGIGVAAERGGSTVGPYMAESQKLLMEIINHKNSRDEERAIATECAIGALGKIVYFFDSTNVAVFLNSLPLVAEAEEAQNVHSQFLIKILEKNKNLFAQELMVKQAILKIATVAKSHAEWEILNENGEKMMVAILSQLK